MKFYTLLVCCFLVIHSVCGRCDLTTELFDALVVDQKNNDNKTETHTEEIYDVLQISNTMEDKDARIFFLQKEIQKLQTEMLQLTIENEQLKLFKQKSIQKRTANSPLQNLNDSKSNTDEIFLLLQKYESNLQLCNENYRCAKNEIFQLEVNKTDAELKLNRCSNVLENIQNAFNKEISAVIELQNSMIQLNSTLIQVQSQLNLCKSLEVANNDTIHCHVQLESLGLEFIGYKEYFRKLHAKVSATENELQTCEQKLSDQNHKLTMKLKDTEELSESLAECQRKSGIVANQTQMIGNEVRENVNNLEQSISMLKGKLTDLESGLQNKISSLTNDVSTLTNKLEIQKNLNNEQHQLLSSQLKALSQETQFLNSSVVSMRDGDGEKQRGLERLRQTGGLVDLSGDLFYLRSEPKYDTEFSAHQFWIGMLRVSKPTGGYSWIWQGTQDSVRYKIWHSNEPSAHTGEECVEIDWRENKHAWNNINCEDNNGVICELIP